MSATSSPPTSPTLLRLLAVAGSEAAWEAFVAAYSPVILAHARRAGLSDADAEEVRSRVLVKLVAALRTLRYDPARSFRGYLRAAVRTAVADWWAEHDGLTELPDPDRLPAPMGELGDLLDDRLSARLAMAGRVLERVQRLVRPDNWRAYWRTAIDGVPAAEVADELGKTVGAVYQAKHRVAGLLRQEGQREADACADGPTS